MKLHFTVGDATKPIDRPTIIAHVCNDVDKWGAGFVVQLGKAYPQAKIGFHSIKPADRRLGYTQFVRVSDDIVVANMIAQEGTRVLGGDIPLRYDALRECLDEVQNRAESDGYTVSMPRIGAGLAGGDWKIIRSIIVSTMRVDTYVYTLPSEIEKWPETRKEI